MQLYYTSTAELEPIHKVMVIQSAEEAKHINYANTVVGSSQTQEQHELAMHVAGVLMTAIEANQRQATPVQLIFEGDEMLYIRKNLHALAETSDVRQLAHRQAAQLMIENTTILIASGEPVPHSQVEVSPSHSLQVA